MSQKCCKNVPKMFKKCSKKCPKNVPNISKKCPKNVPKMSQTCPKNVPKMSYACLIYINELIMSFLHKEDPHLNLFKSYVNFCKKIDNLENQLEIEKMLRKFELSLLQEIGYGIDL